MKTILFHSALFIMFLSMVACHKEGCTDPSALNYDVTADKDDGSCIVCRNEQIPLDNKTCYIIDGLSNSIHFQDTIARADLKQVILSPGEEHCGKPTSPITLSLTSLINEKMYLTYRINRESGPLYINANNDIILEPHQTSDVGVIQTITYPPFYELSLDSIVAETNGQVYYY